MKDVAVKLSDWQDKAAFLAAAKSARGFNLGDRLDALDREVKDERQRLNNVVDVLPEHLRSHGRVVDIVRAIDALIGKIDGLR